MTSIFQFCTPCNKNQSHFWVNANTFECRICSKQTKVSTSSGAVATDWEDLAVLEAPKKTFKPQTYLGLIRTIKKAHKTHVSS